MILFLLGLILLKYQGNPGSLFAGYPTFVVWCFIASHFANWILLSKVKQRMPQSKYLGVLIHAILGFGLISVLSLLLVLLPHQMSFAPRWIWKSMPLLLASLVFHAAHIWYRSIVKFSIHGILVNMFRLRGVDNLTDVGIHSLV